MDFLPGIGFEDLGEAMRPTSPEAIRLAEERENVQILDERTFRLSREERDYVAAHALDSIGHHATILAKIAIPGNESYAGAHGGSTNARKVAVLSNLLGDIGWEREALPLSDLPTEGSWFLGELFSVAHLRPWLEGWVKEDTEALCEAERILEATRAREAETGGREHRKGAQETAAEKAEDKLGTGGFLLARLKKWMASHGN